MNHLDNHAGGHREAYAHAFCQYLKLMPDSADGEGDYSWMIEESQDNLDQIQRDKTNLILDFYRSYVIAQIAQNGLKSAGTSSTDEVILEFMHRINSCLNTLFSEEFALSSDQLDPDYFYLQEPHKAS